MSLAQSLQTYDAEKRQHNAFLDRLCYRHFRRFPLTARHHRRCPSHPANAFMSMRLVSDRLGDDGWGTDQARLL